MITASSGDDGDGVEVPAAYATVTAVGGTSLARATGSRGWSEAAWNGAGSGCSQYVSKPSWQKDAGCSKRTVADVAAVADPNTGVAAYDSYRCRGASLFDVTSGSNGSCGGSYLCTAGSGYDGPTGNGTPNGTGAF